MSETTTEAAAETAHFIWLRGGMHGSAELTATGQDGRLHRRDGRGEWEPLAGNGEPDWYRVSPEIAAEWTDTSEQDEVHDAAEEMHEVLTRIRREALLTEAQYESAIRACEAWEHVR